MLELAVYLSIKQGDEAAFERNYSQLRVYYSDARALLAPSGQEAALAGLNLLRLLVQNRIAEFHTELEVVPPEVLQRPEVAQVRGLVGGRVGWVAGQLRGGRGKGMGERVDGIGGWGVHAWAVLEAAPLCSAAC